MVEKPVVSKKTRIIVDPAQYDLEVWPQLPAFWRRLFLGLLTRVRHPEAILAIGAIVGVLKITGAHAQGPVILFAIGCITVVAVLTEWTDAKNHGNHQRHKKKAAPGDASQHAASN
jgi:hypothetical protein